MFKKRLLIIAVIGAAAVVIDVWFSTSLLQRFAAGVHASSVKQTPLESIRASLREQTPVGTSAADVYAFVDKRGWRLLSELEFDGSGGFYGRPNTNGMGFTHTCIAADLGCYRLRSDYKLTDVRVMWGFDPSNRLVVVDPWEQTRTR
jgi:hypothetical protein